MISKDNQKLLKDLTFFHIDTAKKVVTGLPLITWFIPFLIAVAILILWATPIGWVAPKPVQEIVAVTTIILAAILAVTLHRSVGEKFTLLVAAFICVVMLREIHIPSTSNPLYLCMAGILIWASIERRVIGHWFKDRLLSILLAGGFFTYLLSALFDQHLFFFLPGYDLWHDHVEETLETSGHFMMFLSLLQITAIHTRSKKPE